MMNMCNKCGKIATVLVLLLGLALLLRDLGVWDFWNIQWYTGLIILWGIACIGKSGCPECQKRK
ncbi:hypothetical protein HY486_00495 [Candidatus Woesearchaeota archaeon]|nr:hypothetical protein [Candidatus Woesearchaeota archaeon]